MGIAGRDGVEAMRDFVERHGLTEVPMAADVDGEVWSAWNVPGQPAWVFLDGQTGESRSAFGALGAQGLQAEVDALRGDR